MKCRIATKFGILFSIFFFPFFLFSTKNIYHGGIIINAYHSDVPIFHVIPSPVDVSSNYAYRACRVVHRVMLAVNEYKLMFLKYKLHSFEYFFKKSRFNHR